MILDSNIIIYAARPENAALRQFISQGDHAVSAVSWIECFGYHQITEEERIRLKVFFDHAQIIEISMDIIYLAADMRRKYKMDLGDSIVAATTIQLKSTLATHNTADFQRVPELNIYDPLTIAE